MTSYYFTGKFDFSESDSSGYSSIIELIEESMRKSSMGHSHFFRGNFSPIHFLHPVSRFLQMQSLQHICRFQILENVRRDHIESLPIPASIKDYLREHQYYVENLEGLQGKYKMSSIWWTLNTMNPKSNVTVCDNWWL